MRRAQGVATFTREQVVEDNDIGDFRVRLVREIERGTRVDLED